MKSFCWNARKNEALATAPRVSFESVVVAIASGGLLDILSHAVPVRYPRQKILVVEAQIYVYLVPFVEESDYFFLETIVRNRKATRHYSKRGEVDDYARCI